MFAFEIFHCFNVLSTTNERMIHHRIWHRILYLSFWGSPATAGCLGGCCPYCSEVAAESGPLSALWGPTQLARASCGIYCSWTGRRLCVLHSLKGLDDVVGGSEDGIPPSYGHHDSLLELKCFNFDQLFWTLLNQSTGAGSGCLQLRTNSSRRSKEALSPQWEQQIWVSMNITHWRSSPQETIIVFQTYVISPVTILVCQSVSASADFLLSWRLLFLTVLQAEKEWNSRFSLNSRVLGCAGGSCIYRSAMGNVETSAGFCRGSQRQSTRVCSSRISSYWYNMV